MIRILIFISFLGIINSSYAQYWVNDVLTNYFENEPVYDVESDGNSIWVVTKYKGIFNYQDVSFKRYCIDSSKQLMIKDNDSSKCERFDGVVVDENTLVFYKKTIFSNESEMILKFNNNKLVNCTPSFFRENSEFYFTDIQIDSEEKIWFIAANAISHAGSKYLGYITIANEFVKYYNPVNNNDGISIQNFYIHNNCKYIITKNKKENADSVFYTICVSYPDSNTIIPLKHENSKNYISFKSFKTKENLFLLSETGYLYILADGKLKRTLMVIPDMTGEMFNFAVVGNFVYIFFNKKFIKYNLENSQITDLPLYRKNTLLRKIVIYRNKLIGVLVNNDNATFYDGSGIIKAFQYE